MKTFSHLWQYLAEFFLEWEMFQTNVVEKIRTHILYSEAFFRKSCRWWGDVEKYGGSRGAANDVTMWRIRVACWINMHTDTLPGTHMHARSSRRENQNTHFIFNNVFPDNRAVYDIIWKNIVHPDRPQMTMRIACWITKAKDSHSEYVILIVFPRQ